jgi:uncharacterized membrane protein
MKRNKKEDILLNTDNDDISMLAEIQTDPDEVTAMEFNKEIPVMPLRNMVMFPSVVMPVTIGRPSTLKLINAAYKKKLPIAVVCQIQGDMDDPGFNDVYHVGVIGKILRVFEMPGGNRMMGLIAACISVFSYAGYIIGIRKTRAVEVNSTVLTCYVMGLGALFFLLGGLFYDEGVRLETNVITWLYIGGLALPATAISNITLVKAVKLAGPTLTSLLGALEPLTAVLVGVFVFKELFTTYSALGIILVVISVSLVLFQQKRTYT